MPAAEGSPWSVVERAARDAYGRLVASLAVRFRDIAAAEDALAEALREALERWPTQGVPRSPEAWLTTVAKNELRQRVRHRAVADDPRTTAALEQLLEKDEPPGPSPDARLNLMFVCAHPALDRSIQTPLMLQVVLGLDADRIGAAYRVPGKTMGQRLVRAKQKVRDAGIPFEVPERRELDARLHAVLEGIYAAFGTGWDEVASAPASATGPHSSLDEEAVFLAELLAELVPYEPEVLGLSALLQLSHARRAARFDREGRFVRLSQQDTSSWDRDAILRGDALLLRAAAFRRPGSFQLEAAIQSAHCQRLFSGTTPWRAICMLYEALNRSFGTIATHVAHAAALAELGELDDAWRRLATIHGPQVATYPPYHVVRGHVALLRGDRDDFVRSTERAIELTKEPSLRLHLRETIERSVNEAESAL